MKRANDHICPRCGGPVPRAGAEGQYPGALSRTDNETEICSACGTDEALRGFFHKTEPVMPRWQWYDRTGVRFQPVDLENL